MTVDGRVVPEEPDLVRMRAERHGKLQAQLAAHDLDALLLIGTSAVAYATGAGAPGCDAGRASLVRPVAIVIAGAHHPHLCTPYPEGVPPELPADHVHPLAPPDTDDGAAVLADLVRELAGGTARLAADEVPHPLSRALDGLTVRPATPLLGAAKLHKTADELACIRLAQHFTEQAMRHVEPLLRRATTGATGDAGLTQTDLTAEFVRLMAELGGEHVGVDPIWQVMEPTRAEGPWSAHGDLAFPTPSGHQVIEPGDVIWVDTGVHVAGYASDFGRTWIAGPDPTPSLHQQDQFERWQAVYRAALDRCRPGVATLEVARAAVEANGGSRPWIEHFYLAHGVGTHSVEMPLVGTDLGDRFDAQQILEPGMVLVFEPVIWDEGHAGYRAEEVVAVTDDGCLVLSDHPWDPFTLAAA